MDERVIKVGTLSKTLRPGRLCGSRQLIDWLVNQDAGGVFSPRTCAAQAAAAVKPGGWSNRTGAAPALLKGPINSARE